jgi:hypothetical protein
MKEAEMTYSFSTPSEPDTLAQWLSLSQPLPSFTNLVLALTSLLTVVCSTTEWEYGETWIPLQMQPILELSSAWCIDPNLEINRAISWMQFQMCSQSFSLRPGEGMPGRVWQSLQPEWLNDASAQSETYFLRNQIAKALDVKAGFGIPIIVNSQVLAVVVFFMSRARSPDAEVIEQTQTTIRSFQSNFL